MKRHTRFLVLMLPLGLAACGGAGATHPKPAPTAAPYTPFERVAGTSAARQSTSHAPQKARLFVSPLTVNVGQRVTLSVVAPVPSTVHISFHSAHHFFTGTAVYHRSSRSYVESVRLIPRVHGTERAQVVASVRPRHGRPYQLHSQFFIRGESPPPSNGIPQNNGGDHDGDNNGGPSDGDGNV